MRLTITPWAFLLLVHCQTAHEADRRRAQANAVANAGDPTVGEPVAGEQVPADFPLSILAHAEVRSAARLARNGGAMFNVTILTEQQPNAVADYYGAALAVMGIRHQRHVLESGDSLTVILHGHDDKNRVVLQASNGPTDAKTTVLLHWVKD